MSSIHLAGVLAAFALAAAPSSARPVAAPAACPAGQVSFKGGCVQACPEGTFKEADACECQPKHAKVFFGNGGAECRPAVCPEKGEFSAKRECDCAEGYAKKAGKKGAVKCVATSSKKAAKKTAKADAAGSATAAAPAKKP